VIRKPIRLLALLALCALAAQPQARVANLAGRLLDPSGAPVPAAPIRLRGAAGESTELSDAGGAFRFNSVAPGSYDLSVAIAGFDALERRIRIGSAPPAPLTLRLALAARKDTVTVADGERRVSIDAGQNAGAISVEREMLDNLPILDLNYLAALGRFLDPGSPGGSGTSIIVDGMEMRSAGVTASAIQEIRINNNPYTAEFPRWSRRRIEVITKSSTDRYHGTVNVLFRDHRLNAREALALTRPREQRRIAEGSLFGPVGSSKKAAFLLSASREEEDLQAVVFALRPSGPVRENVATPQVNSFVSARLTWQPNDRHAIFVQQNFQDRWQNYIGVGGTTLAEAGAQSRFREDEFIINHRVVVSSRLVSQFRILLGRYWAPTKSNSAAPRVTVNDAFTGGGAQQDRLSTEAHTSITWLLTQTAGKHSMKYGFNVPDWSRRGLSDRTNQLGTLFYASLGDYSSSKPYAAIFQRGDPKLVFIEKTVGVFFQDEWQVRPNLSVAAGFRYDWQNYFGDRNNVGPRLSLAYAPGGSRKTVLRAGTGLFSDRSGPGPIYDILRYNAAHLRRYVVSGTQIGAPLDSLPFSIHGLAPGTGLPNALQFSAGVERQLAKKTTLAANYVGVRAFQQLRSRDGNAPLPPVFGSRPDPTLNVRRWIESAGRMEGNSFEVTLRGELARGVNGTAQYVLGKTMADTGGVGWFPASSYAPAGEWGRADTDRRQQFNFLGTAALHRWASFGLSVSLLSAIPFNITTGRDENGDGMALERPAGVTRNTGHGPGYATLDLRWYREWKFRPKEKDKSPSVTVSADAFNLFNRVNYQNYLGSLSSPFFGNPVATQPARRMQVALRFQF
jgi:outer membrane receptor protein involved in Fe transport